MKLILRFILPALAPCLPAVGVEVDLGKGSEGDGLHEAPGVMEGIGGMVRCWLYGSIYLSPYLLSCYSGRTRRWAR